MVVKIFFKVGDVLDLFAKALSGILLCFMTIIMISEVISRNVYMSLTWSDELAATFFGTWFIFIGAAVPLRAGQLIGIQFIQSVLPPKIAKVVIIVGELMALIFLLVIIKYGFELVKFTMTQPSPALMYPMGLAYLAIPLGGILMFYQTLVLIFQNKSIIGGSSMT